jgi:hypothetical protein
MKRRDSIKALGLLAVTPSVATPSGVISSDIPYRIVSTIKDRYRRSVLNGIRVMKETATKKRGDVLVIEFIRTGADNDYTCPIEIGKEGVWEFIDESNEVEVLYRSMARLECVSERGSGGEYPYTCLTFKLI